MKIAYLGPQGTFTHKAATLMQPQAELIPIKSIPRVMRATQEGQFDGAVIPYENVYNFTVTSTLKQLLKTNLKINEQVRMQVKHCFGYNPDSENITHVYSKDQALEQCELWLDTHYPNADLVCVDSTAAGADIARKTKGAAAIAPIGVMGGLAGIVQDIVPNNYTRFFQLGFDYGEKTDNDSSLVVLDIPDKSEPGMLEKCLHAYSEQGINHSCVQSWPNAKGGYYFIIESDAHIEDVSMQHSLKELGSMGIGVKIVGSYNQ